MSVQNPAWTPDSEEFSDELPFAVTASTYTQEGTTLDWSDDFNEDDFSSDLVVPLSTDYWKVQWFNGFNFIVDQSGNDTEETIKGLAIPYSRAGNQLPAELQKALDSMIAKKLARRVGVRHGSGAVVQYAILADESYKVYPLILGLPTVGKKKNEIIPNDAYYTDGPLPDIAHLIGVVSGRTTKINKEKTKQSTFGFCSALLVVDSLWEHGYVDVQGRPIPLCFEAQGYAAPEWYAALKKHMEVVLYARTLPQYSKVMPYQLGMYLRHNNTRIDHVAQATGQKSKAHEVVIQVPQQLTEAYVKRMYAPDALQKKLKPLLYERYATPDGVVGMRPGGIAIQWCREVAVNNVNEQRSLNPNTPTHPFGELVWGKDKDLSPRLQMRFTRTTTQGSVEAAETENPYKRQILDYKGFFERANNSDMAKACQSTLDMLDALDEDTITERLNMFAETKRIHLEGKRAGRR